MSDAMYVKNAVVKDNFWLVEDFFETHDDGFVAATQVYSTPNGDITIVFKDRKAGVLLDDETQMPASRDDVKAALVDMTKQGIINDPLDETMGDSWVEVGMMGVFTSEELLDDYGFTDEQKEDVIARMDDLENYWETNTEDMG